MSKILNRIERGAEKLFLDAIGVSRGKRKRATAERNPQSVLADIRGKQAQNESKLRKQLAGADTRKPPKSQVIEGGREDLADGRIALWVPRRLLNEQSPGMSLRDGSKAPWWRWENDFRDRTFAPMLQAYMRDVRPELVREVWFVQVTPENANYRFDSDNGMRACKRSMRDPIARFFGRDDADHEEGSIQWSWGWAYGDGFGVLALFGGECLELAEPVDGHIYVPRKDGTEIAITYRKRL